MENTHETVFKIFRQKVREKKYYCKCGEMVREIDEKWEHYGMDGMSETQKSWDERTNHPIEIMVIDSRVKDFCIPYRALGY